MVAFVRLFRISDPTTTIDEMKTFEKHFVAITIIFLMLEIMMSMQRKTFKRTRNSTKLADCEIIGHKMSMTRFLEELYDRNKGYSCLVWQWWNTVTFFSFGGCQQCKKME